MQGCDYQNICKRNKSGNTACSYYCIHEIVFFLIYSTSKLCFLGINH